MFKKRYLCFAILTTLLCAGSAFSEGDCDRSMWGNNEMWQSYDAGGLEIEMRVCSSKYGMSHVDIKNIHNYDLCLKIVADKTGRRWSAIPLRAGKISSWSAKNTKETWRVGAKRMDGTYCKSQ